MSKQKTASKKPSNTEGFHVIIVAAGNGTRMNSAVPKQFMKLAGKPMLLRTIEKFSEAIPTIHIIVVLSEERQMEWKLLCKKNNFTTKHQIAFGGNTRFDSVKNGLALVPNNSIVGIHDAARPLVSAETIAFTFKTAYKKGNACPSITINESIREVTEKGNKAVNRSNYHIIQTPQCFQSNKIKKAFAQEYNALFTDDASVMESIGEKINLVEGNRENMKITTQQDFLIAELLLKKKQNQGNKK